METLLKDLRYGVRMLTKNPGVSLIAVLTLALGIGANTAIFSVVSAVLLNPLPYQDPDRLVSIWENVPQHGRWRAAPANFLDWKKQNTVFEDVAAFGGATATLTGDGDPEQLSGTAVTPGYFEVVGVHPALGRTFQPEEYELGKDRVVILSHGLWQRRYGGDKNILNRTVTLDGNSSVVVGVMPPGLYPTSPTTAGRINFDERQDFWRPMSYFVNLAALRRAHILGVLARLKPDITIEQAHAEMTTIGARLAQEHVENKDEGIIVNRFMNEVVGDVRPALITLLVAVGLVLLIACANIAGLLLAQHAARTKEIAIRAALGAGRARLVRQFFIEGLLLSVLGTLAGLGLAQLGLKVLLNFVPQQVIPRLAQVGLDWRVLAFTLLLSLVTCLLFGLIPAWHASKPDLQTALEQSGRTSGPAAARLRFRQLLVVFQVSVAVMLVIGAGLLVKSFWLLQRVDPGFRAERVLSAELTLPSSKYAQPADINNFFKQLLERVSAMPGVESATIAYDHPLQSNWLDAFQIEGRVVPVDGQPPSANFIPVSPGYFETVKAEIVRGRTFTPQDDADHPGAVIVNEAFVRHYFPNEEPLGRRILPSPPARIWRNQRLTSFEIVGVVHDVKFDGLAASSEPAYYLPAAQAPLNDMTLLVRTTSDPRAVVSSLRQAVWSIDPNQPISKVNTLQQIVSASIAQPRLNMLLMLVFGGLALLLSAVGIYGLLSYAVTQRTQELGIRMALGANVTDVLKLVLKQGMLLALIGEAIGLAGAFALTRLMRGLLFGVTPTDTSIFAGVVVVLTFTALLACYLPARRATKVDPLVALRYE
jgi:putative ABC transport system permease protein